MNLLNYYPREVGGGVISYPDLTLFYVGDLGTRLGEVYSVFQVTGMFESGQKSKPPPKKMDKTLTRKESMPKIRSLKNGVPPIMACKGRLCLKGVSF